MAKSIYDQHRAAFPTVAAYVVMRGAERVATLAIKYHNTVTAYVHWHGVEMQRGRAGGGGYDRVSAALSVAAALMPAALPEDAYSDGTPHYPEAERESYLRFRAALLADDGFGWGDHLRKAGFTVWQAV